MDLGFHLPIFDIDGGTTAIAGELARVGAVVEAAGVNWLSFMRVVIGRAEAARARAS